MKMKKLSKKVRIQCNIEACEELIIRYAKKCADILPDNWQSLQDYRDTKEMLQSMLYQKEKELEIYLRVEAIERRKGGQIGVYTPEL
jgi:hypothetical protein